MGENIAFTNRKLVSLSHLLSRLFSSEISHSLSTDIFHGKLNITGSDDIS